MAKIPSLEELNKLYENLGGQGDLVPQSQKGGKKKKVSVKGPPAVDNLSDVPDEAIYSEVHFFLREKATWTHVLQDAKSEKSVRGSTVLVFAHNHSRGKACDHLCRGVYGE